MSLSLRYNWNNLANQVPFELSLTDVASAVELALTRTGDASVTDYFNIIKTVASGEERYTGGRRVENLARQSNDFDTVWSTSNVTLAEGAAGSGPAGDGTAWTMTDDATDAIHAVNINSVIQHPSRFTVSVYAKAGTANIFLLGVRTYTGTTADGRCSWFDLTAGTLIRKGSAHTDAGIESIGDGWYRCWFYITPTSSNNDNIYLGMAEGTVETDSDYSGSSDTILIAKAQGENVDGQDDPVPSEYVATTAATASKWYATKRRTNLVLQSNDLDTTWANTRLNEVAAAAANPLDGTVDAWSLDEDGTAAQNHSIRQTSLPIKFGQRYTFSGYFKASNRDWFALRLDNIAGSGRNCYFDLANGVVGNVGSGCTSGIEDVGGGWYRCWMQLSVGILTPLIYLAEGNGDLVFDGLSQESILVYGLQAEHVDGQSSYAPSAYIPTTTTVESSDFDTAINPTGLLVEEARTNICVQSEDLSTTWVTDADNTAETDQAIAPDGKLTADQIIDDSSTGTSVIWARQLITFSTSTVYTYSVYLKADQLSWARLAVLNMGSLVILAHFDLTNGVLGATTGANNTSEFIEDVGNGWFRCGITFTSDSSDVSGNVYIYPADGDNDITVDLDGTSSIFVWGAQVEAGAFQTSYIPTVAGTVTRNVDLYASADVTWLNQDAGSHYVKAVTDKVQAGQASLFAVTKDVSTYFKMQHFDATRARAYHFTTTGDDGLVLFNYSQAANVASEYAVAYADDDMRCIADGGTANTDTSVSVPTVPALDAFVVGMDQNNTKHWNGNIAEIRYYSTRLTDEQLEDMSNGIFPTFEDHINDLQLLGAALLAFYQANGATSDHIDDAEMEYLITQGATQAQLGDMWNEYLTGKGYSGTLDDMKHTWWLAGGPV